MVSENGYYTLEEELSKSKIENKLFNYELAIQQIQEYDKIIDK